MDIPPQSSPKRKEPAGEEKLVQLDDLRTLLKEERQSWKEELKHEFQGWSSKVSTTLEKFEGELSQVATKIQNARTRWKHSNATVKLKPAELVNLKNAWEPWKREAPPLDRTQKGTVNSDEHL